MDRAGPASPRAEALDRSGWSTERKSMLKIAPGPGHCDVLPRPGNPLSGKSLLLPPTQDGTIRTCEARHFAGQSALSLRLNAGPCQEICLDDETVIHAPQPKGIAESSGGRHSRPQPRWGWGRWVGRPTQGSGANAATLGFIPLPRWGIGDRAQDGPRTGPFTSGRVWPAVGPWRLSGALKGRCTPAQGNALGTG
jgi:hypothetical protein